MIKEHIMTPTGLKQTSCLAIVGASGAIAHAGVIDELPRPNHLRRRAK